MTKYLTFLQLPGNAIYLERLDEAALPALQFLLDCCADFSLLVEGEPPGKTAAQDLLADLPPGKSPAEKFLFGIFSENALAGVLDAVQDYPQDSVWWIGLLLIDPAERGKHLGEQSLHIFEEWASQNGAQSFMLGVIDGNQHGRQFWKRMGFELIEKRPPRLFGQKEHVVQVMKKDIAPSRNENQTFP